MSRPDNRYERAAHGRGCQFVAGVDESGRGSLFGPVVAAAVVLDPKRRIHGLDDSKKLTAEQRTAIARRIRKHAIAWAVAAVDAREIDATDILRASKRAMEDAIRLLPIKPECLLIDGPPLGLMPGGCSIEQEAIIDGDALSNSIAAASIIAKVERDRLMENYDRLYPQYGLGEHKGYATVRHKEALRVHGPSPEHRLTFAPVRRSLQRELPFA